MNDKPTIPPSVAEYALEQLAANTTHDEFTDAQWWYTELDAVAKTADQRRAMAVVRNLMHQYGSACTKATACEVLRARLAKYEDAEGNPISTIAEQAREIERLRLNIAEYNEHERCYQSEIAALKAQPGGVFIPHGLLMRVLEPVTSEQYINAKHELLELMRLNQQPASGGWMMPTAQQLEQALESVPSFHDLSAELIAPAMLEHLRDVISAGDYGDAYRGARDESLIWKRRALEAETKVREQDQIIENLGNALNNENGPTFMGEPVIRAGGMAERAAFDEWFTDHSKDWPFPSESIKSMARSNDWLVWQARATLTASAPNHSEQVRQMVPDAFLEASRQADDVLTAIIRNNEPIATLERTYGKDWHEAVGKIRTALILQIAATPSAGNQEQGE